MHMMRKDSTLSLVFPIAGLSILSFMTVSTGACSINPIRWLDCKNNVPSILSTAFIGLEDLPETLHCGQIDVPMDYAKPMGEGNMITLGFAMHRPEIPKGALFINTGGSDPVAVEAWKLALNQSKVYSGLLDYDLMMMDVRGTYSSNPLNVSLATLGAVPIAYPKSEAEFDVYKQASAAFFQSWIDSSSPSGIIEHVGTKEVVQDYERIRQALGYNKINFLGMSYGSYRAQQYAVTFPERVGHFALDSVFTYGQTLSERATNQIEAVNRAVLRADAYCHSDPSCPFRKHGRGSVPRIYREIISAAEHAETSCTKNCANMVPAAAIKEALFSMYQGQPDFPAILSTLDDARGENFTALLGGPSPSIEGVVALPLECGDFAYNELDYSDFKKSLHTGLAHDDTSIGRTQIWQLQLYCSGWPFKVVSGLDSPNRHRMLLVTADFDLSAPTEWTTFAWRHTSHSALVVRHGDDHVSFLLPEQPSSKITTEFLRSGTLPHSRHETLVSVYSPGMKRPPVSNPYNVPIGAVAGDIDSE